MTTKRTTMPKTTMPTREQIEQEADAAATRAAQLRQALAEQDQAALDRRLEAQRAWDEQHVAGFSRAAVEAEVDRAKAALDAALAENPLVLALADYLHALRRRSHDVFEHMSALGRLGRPTGSPAAGPTELGRLEEYVITAAERLATERVDREQAEMHARRDAAGADTEGQS